MYAKIDSRAFLVSGDDRGNPTSRARQTTTPVFSPPPYRQKKWQYSMGLGGAVKAMLRVSGS